MAGAAPPLRWLCARVQRKVASGADVVSPRCAGTSSFGGGGFGASAPGKTATGAAASFGFGAGASTTATTGFGAPAATSAPAFGAPAGAMHTQIPALQRDTAHALTLTDAN